jgi:hypothetical protein
MGKQQQFIMHKGLREVQTVTVIRTTNCIGTGMVDDPVRTVEQYWTAEGEQISTGESEKKMWAMMLLETWAEKYEKEFGEGKVKDFLLFAQKQGLAD